MTDSNISSIQRANVRKRWDRTTPDQRKATMAGIRQQRLDKVRASVAADFDKLGIIPTPEQLQTASDRAVQAARVESLTKARAAIARQRADEAVARERLELLAYNDPWMTRVMRVAGGWIDNLVHECPPSPWSPQAANNMSRTIAKVIYMMLSDEFAKPEAERDFQYLSMRYEDYRLYVHARSCSQTRLLGSACLICGLTGEAAIPEGIPVFPSEYVQ